MANVKGFRLLDLNRERLSKTPQGFKKAIGINPFINELIIDAINVTSKTTDVIERKDTITGIFTDYTTTERNNNIGITKTFDIEKYCKIYRNDAFKEIYKILSNQSAKFIGYIEMYVEENTDYIQLTYDNVNNAIGLSITAYNLSIKELRKYAIINESVLNSYYFINPKFIFCGSRIKKYPDKVKLKFKEKLLTNKQ